jgi:hypothetical protein
MMAAEGSGSSIGEPRFEDGKALRIAGISKLYTPDTLNNISSQWQSFAPHIGKIPGQTGRDAYGVVTGHDDEFHYDYLSGVEVMECVGLPDDFTCINIPAPVMQSAMNGFLDRSINPRVRKMFQIFLSAIPKSSVRIKE